jgi:hypothetical protein
MDLIEMMEIAQKKEERSEEYATERINYTQAKLKFDYILASKFKEYIQTKRNIGYDTARLLLLSEADEEVLAYDTAYHLSEARYKGLEKVIDAMTEKIQLGKKLISLE